MDQKKSYKKYIVIGLIIVALIMGLMAYFALRRFTSYDVKKQTEIQNAGETEYLNFQENLLAYNRDGITYTDYDGDLIWAEAYEMDSPRVVISGSYILIYDKSGTQMLVADSSGICATLGTTLPITQATLSESGTVAVLMRESDAHYIRLYDLESNLLASGELHTTNTGYPISLAISSDGKKLLVSLVDINDGDVKSKLLFYNFGKAGQEAEDNVVATFSYSDMVIPEVAFLSGDRAIAFGDREIVLFSSADEPAVTKELFYDEEIRTIFYNRDFFGCIVGDSEEGAKTLTVYNCRGTKRFSAEVEDSYTEASILDSNEILLTDGQQVSLYNIYGVKKFTYDFTEGILSIIPWDGSTNYIFIKSGLIEKVRLQ